jgi:activator of HSP90 ATPase
VHTHSLSLKERFYCKRSDIFDCFIVEGKVKGFTQSPAEVEAVPGGRWSWFGGSITGTFEEIEAPKKLVLTWRFSSWEDGVGSKVRAAGGGPCLKACFPVMPRSVLTTCHP